MKTIFIYIIKISLIHFSLLNIDCNELMINYLKNFNPINFTNPITSTGTGYNDFGKYDLCKENNFSYYLYKITFNIPSNKLVPLFNIFVGICIPQICYNETIFEDWKKLAEKYLKLPSDNMKVIQSIEENNKYKKFDNLSILIMLFILLFVLFSSGLIKLFRDWYKQKVDNQIEINDKSEMQSLSKNEIVNNELINKKLENYKNENNKNEIINKTEKQNTIFQNGIINNLFDISNNYKIMFKSSINENLKAINGIKTITMIFIIYLSMIMIFTTYPIPIRNPERTLEYVRSFIWQFIFNNTYCYDIFFFISAFYLSYKFLSKKNEKISFNFIILKIFHKFLKYYPVYIIIFLIYYFFFIYTLNGPISGYLFNNEIESCQEHFPIIIFLLQDFTYGAFSGSSINQNYLCYNWSWFPLSLLHYYFLGCILIYFYLRNKKRFYKFWFILFLFNFILEIFIFTFLNYGITYYELHMKNMKQYFELYYSKVFMRISPYLIGLICGIYYFEKINDENSLLYKSKNNFFIKISFYFGGLILMLSIIFIGYFTYSKEYSILLKKLNLLIRVFYNVLSRKLFVIGFFFFMIPLLQKSFYFLGGFVNNNCFIFLNKILFTTYLIHPLFIRFILLNARYQLYFEGWYFLLYGSSIVILSFIFGFIFSLLFEIPMNNTKIYLFDEKEKEYIKLNKYN